MLVTVRSGSLRSCDATYANRSRSRFDSSRRASSSRSVVSRNTAVKCVSPSAVQGDSDELRRKALAVPSCPSTACGRGDHLALAVPQETPYRLLGGRPPRAPPRRRVNGSPTISGRPVPVDELGGGIQVDDLPVARDRDDPVRDGLRHCSKLLLGIWEAIDLLLALREQDPPASRARILTFASLSAFSHAIRQTPELPSAQWFRPNFRELGQLTRKSGAPR